MQCYVPNCYNKNSRPLDNDVSLHTFPTDIKKRILWVKALNLPQWEPKESSAVCSEHFNRADMILTKKGVWRVTDDAVPLPEENASELDSLAIYKVCRICLSANTKTYDIKETKNIYETLTGIDTDSAFLPRVVCYECRKRLKNAQELREKAIKAERLLTDVLNQKGCLTLRNIKSINKYKNKLNSNLIQTIIENDEYDLLIKDDEIIKTEINNEFNDIINDNNQYNDEDNGNNGMDNEYNDTVNDPIVEISLDIKNENSNNELFLNEYGNDSFESDDDMKLSEIVQPKSKGRVKKDRDKVKKDRDKVERKVKKKDVRSAMDRLKTADIKRRKLDNGLEDSLFTVTQLTYEEQVKEVEQRQETNAYKTAPFQCNVCYRGFPVKDRYEVHLVRHSEQSGAFECFICKTRLKTMRALRKHLTSQHTEKFTCKGCPFVTKNRGVARAHAKWHAGTKYQCHRCPATFDKITTYMGHIRIKHVSDFVCQLCGYTFVSEKGIEVHKKKKHRLESYTIPAEGPHCEVCDVRFVSVEAHDRHLKLSARHTREDDPNRIRNDSQSINTVRKMRAYRRIERRPVIYRNTDTNNTTSGPITCEQCGIQLRDLRLYAQHFRRVHPDKNRTKYPAMKTPCMCELCGRIFQSMALLQDHMWVHTGEKRFKCSMCPKSFTQKTNLVCHERIHTNSRPSYECPLCGKQFAFYNNRRRHMFIHTGLKPHKCETCGKCFTTAGEHRAHVDHVHMKKPWPKRTRRRDEYGDKCNED